MREELKQKYEDTAWKSATDVINVFIQSGETARAKNHALAAIENWQAEGKTEIIDRFKEWLKSKDIDPDDLSSGKK